MKPPPPSKPRSVSQSEPANSNEKPVNKPSAPQPKVEDSESDYSDVDEEEDDVGDDDGVYDWFAFDTKAGMESLENQAAPAPAAAAATQPPTNIKDPQLQSEIDDMLKDSDDESDESETYDLVDGEDEEVYDWTSMNTAAGLQEIEKKENITATAETTSNTLMETPANQPAVPKTPKILTQPISPKPKAHQPPAPSMPRIPQSPATPGPMPELGTPNVKDTTKVKRKKASLPTKKPMNAHGSWLTNRYIVNNYILLDALGQGSYAEVRLCKEKTNDQLYAIKIMNKDLLMKKSVGMSSTFMDDVRREVAIMKKLEHKNVLKLYEVMDDPKVNKMYLVLEYCKRGDLMQMTKGDARTNSCNILPEFQVWEVTRQVLHGLKYLHDNDIVHGDLKPQNLLVDKNGVVKIADFGISKMIETSDGEKEKLLETAGTPAFMSPELCAGLAYDGYLADVYAVGATIFMLRCGHPPFVASKLIALYHKIQEEPVVFTDDSVSSGLKNIIEGMMVKDPGKRFTLLRVMEDSWMQIRPGDEKKKTPPAKEKLAIEQNRRVEVSNDEIFMSVHQVAEEGGESSGGGGVGMDEEETERRVKSFKKKASIRQRSFEKLDNLMEGNNSDDEDDDFVKVSKLDSMEFNSVMDTLAHQSPVAARKKQAPIPGLVVGRVLDGLPNSKLGIRAAFHSERGKRPRQEDAVTVIMDLSDLGDSLERPYLYQKFAYFGIYDGHSGGMCSKLLQHRLHTKFSQNPHFFNDQQKAAIESCLATDEEVCAELRGKDDESGSTALFLVIDGRSKKFTVSNVGDCRCVLSRGGTAINLSKDHRVSRKEERERVEKSGGIIKSDRLNGVLAVTRSFGDTAHKMSSGADAALTALPELRTEIITERDELVLLATDGLWDVMDSQNAINMVRKSLNKHHKVKEAVKELVKEAIKLGSVDNVSAVVVVFNQQSNEEGGSGRRK